MDLGSIFIKNEHSLINARNKIHKLCTDFNLNSFSTIRIATMSSDMLRSILNIGCTCQLNISYEKRVDNHGLRFHFISEKINFDAKEMKTFFDSMQKVQKNDEQDFEFFIFLPYRKPVFNEDFISKEKEAFVSKSREELYEETMVAYENIKKKNAFLSMAAHDLRNPLSVITQAVSFFGEGVGKMLSAQELAEMAELVKINASTMKSLIDSLLDIAVIESGEMKLKLEKTDIIEFIKKNVSFNKLIAKQKSIDLLLTDPSFSAIYVEIDRDKFNEVLNNLISNATKYSNPKTSIEISFSKQDENIFIQVKDQGKGIVKENFDKIFTPFGIKGEQGTKGEKSTGLGLVITKKIIEAHGGKIWVESSLEKGSTFFVSLPISK